MFAFVGLVSLVALSSVQAEYAFHIMDMKVPEFTNPMECPGVCNTLMNIGLKGVDLVFTHLLKNLTFNAGFCDCYMEGIGGFTFTQSCTSNEDGTMYDHKVRAEFQTPYASCNCGRPGNSKAAADMINGADTPVGKCGKDKVGNQIPFEPVKGCDDNDNQSDNGEQMQLEAKMNKPVYEATFRIDTREPETVYPTTMTLIFQEEYPYTLKDGPGYENTFKCITNKDNKQNFYRKLMFNIFKPIFDCLDDKNEHGRSIIDTILYFTGNCNNFKFFGR